MKKLSNNNFTTKPFSKLLCDLYIGVHLKGSKKFGSKVVDRQLFHRKTVFHMKILSIVNFTTKLLGIKDYFLNPLERLLKSLLRRLIVKLLIDNIFIERLGCILFTVTSFLVLIFLLSSLL